MDALNEKFFALEAIIHSSQQSAIFCDYPAIIPLLSFIDPKNTSSGSPRTPPAGSGPSTQHVVAYPADSDAICCVLCRFRDRSRRGQKGRFDYSLTVVHFRKVVIRQ
ncbi:hypothetical protein SR98_10685 [Enterobacter hormaechei subsp. xiangfangensis]|nr:hypothetical protein SR98_10685 [Enterobacter hormaechei subsp. xiangfangensis]KJP32389.1 hypothetical protein SR78_13320 [Enterobacter hormaechei subsp. xiangfangensis]